MKTKRIILKHHFMLVMLSVGLLLISCEELIEVDFPKSQVLSDDIFKDDVTATSVVTGMYVDLLGNQNFASGNYRSVLALAGLSADELVNNPRTDAYSVEFQDNDVHPDNDYVFALWTSMYKIIYEANAVIEGLEKSTQISNAVKTQLLGEARFTRAFCHFYLVNLFGNVPLINSTDYKANSLVSRSDESLVYQAILKDLQLAQEELSEQYVSLIQGERARPNRATATALLARVYLFTKQWESAEKQASLIINNSNYFLMPDLNAVFLKNSKEAIWQLRPSVKGTNGYPQEAYYFNESLVIRYNLLSAQIFNTFEPNDKRATNWVKTLSTGSDALYCPFKYHQAITLNTPLAEYSMVFRLAEQYLIRAEARAEQNNIAGAQSDINAIRSRAGLPNTDADTKISLLAAIEHERKVELFAEWGHRWLDLKRWNKADIELAFKPGWNPEDVLYPIPQKERNVNPKLGDQNPGY